MRWLLLAPLFTMGCTAIQGTHRLIQAEQELRFASQEEAEEYYHYVYAITMADAYVKKSWEEYGNADYQAAVEFADEGLRWSQRAQELAESAEQQRMLDRATGIVPEEVEREAVQEIAPREDALDIPDEPEEDW